MTTPPRQGDRTIALDPMTRDLGFAVLEGTRLVGWGVKSLKRRRSTATVVARLVLDFRPTILVLPDYRGQRNPLRRRSLRAFESAIRSITASPTLNVVHASGAKIRAYARTTEARTKYAVARTLVEQYPELRVWLPKPRRFYDKEDPRMGIFDALAMALVAQDSR